jgi:hypothetical protein
VSGFSCPPRGDRCRSAARSPRTSIRWLRAARPAPGRRVRPWSCRWPLSSTPGGPARGAWAVPRHGCGPARGRGRATNVGHGRRGGRAGAARGVARAGAVRDGSATTSTSRVTEPMRAGAGKRKTNNPALKYERRHTRISNARLFSKQCREHTNRQWVGLGAIVRHRLAM